MSKRVKPWMLIPVVTLTLYGYWMLQDTQILSNKSTKNLKPVIENDYALNSHKLLKMQDADFYFEVILDYQKYPKIRVESPEALDIARNYVNDSGVGKEMDISLQLVSYSNPGLGIIDQPCWRVTFKDIVLEKSAEKEMSVGAKQMLLIDQSEQKIKSWIVIDAKTGKIITSYSNSK